MKKPASLLRPRVLVSARTSQQLTLPTQPETGVAVTVEQAQRLECMRKVGHSLAPQVLGAEPR